MKKRQREREKIKREIETILNYVQKYYEFKLKILKM